ncbi:MAG: hypothetical protein PHX70_05900 [Clostridium sp.]|nr:hypothetical protein [Clostridium sp.]
MIQEDIHLNKLKIYKKAVLKSCIYDRREMSCCPNCKHRHYIKYGKFNEIQRYRCKICGKTFSNATGSLWSYSKKDAEKWMKFLELMLERKSLRYCAKELKISVITAFYWRHKVLHVLELDKIQKKLSGYVLMRKIILKENFKGSRKVTTSERKGIWIVGLKDAKDSMIVKPICYGQWFIRAFKDKVDAEIDRKSYMIPYNGRYLRAIGRNHNEQYVVKKNKKMYRNVEEKERYHFFLNLRPWLSCFHGIATKYLDRYFKFFILFDSKKSIDYMDMFHYLMGTNRFIRTSEIRGAQ